MKHGKHYRGEQTTLLSVLEKLFGRHSEIAVQYRMYMCPHRRHIYAEKGPPEEPYTRRTR